MTVQCDTVQEAAALMNAMYVKTIPSPTKASPITQKTSAPVKKEKKKKAGIPVPWNQSEIAFLVQAIKDGRHFVKQISRSPELKTHTKYAKEFQYYTVKRYLDGKGTQYMTSGIKTMVDSVLGGADRRSILSDYNESQPSSTFGSNNPR